MNGRTEIARFVQLVSRMIKIMNIRTPDMERRLRDPDRAKFESVDDPRFSFLHQMVDMFKAMDNKHSRFPGRVMNLSDQTSNALDVSITGVQALIKLLIEKGVDYCLTAEFQSDRIDGEFGTWRQMNGGNYYMSMDNIQSCMKLQRLKLFSRLQQEETVWHARDDFCKNPLSDEELDAVDDCFDSAHINDIELSTLYFISGYVARKENLGGDETETTMPLKQKSCEFTVQLSRGGLIHPSKDLFDLSTCLYTYYEKVPNKSCSNRLLEAFKLIQETVHCSYTDSVLRRFANTFSKGFAKKKTEQVNKSKQLRNMKRGRFWN